MRHLLVLALWLASPLAWALNPYLLGERLPAGELPALLTQVERKLDGQGFRVIGRHLPRGLAGHASVIVTDAAMLDAVGAAGGAAIVAAALRVGVKSDGTVSYMNPDYWSRAYLRAGFAAAQPAVSAVQARLVKALGEGAGFGGDVPADELANYRYMFGMERFDSRTELHEHESFEAAVRTVQDNLAKGTGNTAKVYEVLMPGKQIALFGVALNNSMSGEGWWAGKIGPDHVAALPYEIFVVGNKVHALYARYRIALSWPSLGMGQFMGIVAAPSIIQETMARVAGAPAPAQ